MLNIIWLAMMFIAVIVALIQGRVDDLVQSVTTYARLGFETALGLAGILSLWLGIMNIAQESGLVKKLARFLQPILHRLFPNIPKDHPAMGAMVLNIAANALGLANAATPFGLQAMHELQRLNKHLTVASNEMCTFLAINTSSVQIIPATAIAYLSANGGLHPSQVVVSSLIATTASTAVGIFAVKKLEKLPCYRIKKEDSL